MSTPDGAGLASTAVEPQIPPAVVKRIARAVESSLSEGTRPTYAAGWRRFAGCCEREGHIPLPAHPVAFAAYLVGAADTCTEAGEQAATSRPSVPGSRRSTINTVLPAICPRPHELVTATPSGIRREYAAAGGPAPHTTRPPGGRRH